MTTTVPIIDFDKQIAVWYLIDIKNYQLRLQTFCDFHLYTEDEL